MNRSLVFSFTIFSLVLLTIFGCSEEKSIYETGDKVISMVETDGKNEVEIVVDPSKQNKVQLQAQIDQSSAFGIVVEVESNSTLVDKYNSINNTDYLVLPPSAYYIDVSEFVFPKYTNLSSHVSVSFTSGDMQNDVSYLLPIQMTAISGDDNASIDTENNVIYLKVSKLPPPKLVYLQGVELTTEIGPDKKNWFSAYATNSEGGHTFSVEEAAKQSGMMDFALVNHGSNVRFHPSIIGWQHGKDYQKYIWPYTRGFEKLTMIANINRLFGDEAFDGVKTIEDLVTKIEDLKVSSKYNFNATDRMTSHNLQKIINGDTHVLIQGWGPIIGKNTTFSIIKLNSVTPTRGGHYKVNFDIKYSEVDARSENSNVEGQNVVISNPGYLYSDHIVEYKDVELTTEIEDGKNNWFSAYADNNRVVFTQEEAKDKSEMMDFALTLHSSDYVTFYAPIIGVRDAKYSERIAPYVRGFSKLTYTMLGGSRAGKPDETKAEHYDKVEDVSSMLSLIDYYTDKKYGYVVSDRVSTDKLEKGYVGIIGWGHKIGINNTFGIFRIKDVIPTTGGNYKVIFDIKVPKSNARTPNNYSMVSNSNL